jgi:hypothetical protein
MSVASRASLISVSTSLMVRRPSQSRALIFDPTVLLLLLPELGPEADVAAAAAMAGKITSLRAYKGSLIFEGHDQVCDDICTSIE